MIEISTRTHPKRIKLVINLFITFSQKWKTWRGRNNLLFWLTAGRHLPSVVESSSGVLQSQGLKIFWWNKSKGGDACWKILQWQVNDKLNSKHAQNSLETIRIGHINQVSESLVTQWVEQARQQSDKNTPRIIIHKVRRQLLTYWQERRWTSAQEQEWGFPKYENHKRNIRQNSNWGSHVISW